MLRQCQHQKHIARATGHNATLIRVIFLVKPGNGYIPTTCLREILRELDDQLTNEELDMMIEEIDSDGSGTVDFDGMFSVYFFPPLDRDDTGEPTNFKTNKQILLIGCASFSSKENYFSQ